MDPRTAWALTFEIEQYIKTSPKNVYQFREINPLPKRVISAALKMIFDGVLTPKEMSQEIVDKFNLIIMPGALLDIAQGDFENVKSFEFIKK